MSKCHGRVLCFSLKKPEFEISSRVRSPEIFTSILWSVTTMRLSHPWVKYCVCSRAHTTARASPSIAVYHCSSEERNCEPARVIFHPPWQQLGTPEQYPRSNICISGGWVWLLEYAMPLVWQWGPHVLLGCYGLSLLLWLVCQQKWLWALLGGL